MSAQFKIRVTISTGARYTSTPFDGTAAEHAQPFHRIFEAAEENATLSFHTAQGAVVFHLSAIEAAELIDLPEDPDALADCGDQA